MGYIVSSLASSKYDLEGYCIYLVKDYDLKGVSRDLVDSFDDYADSLKGSSAIFRPTKHSRENYERSLQGIFDRDPWFECTVGHIDKLSPGIIISKPSLKLFGAKNNELFIYASGDVLNAAYKDKLVLFQDILNLCNYEDLVTFYSIFPPPSTISPT